MAMSASVSLGSWLDRVEIRRVGRPVAVGEAGAVEQPRHFGSLGRSQVVEHGIRLGAGGTSFPSMSFGILMVPSLDQSQKRPDTVGESFELNTTAAQEAGTLIGTAKPIIRAQGSVW
jgi:hypothetical protein